MQKARLLHFPLLLNELLLIASPYSCLIVQVQSLHFLIMADPNPLYFISASEDGFFVTFKQLREQKFGNTVPVKSHLRPLSELFSEQQLEEIPVDNKAGENYFGQMAAQLQQKGGASFRAVGERLVLSSNADIAFSGGSEKMLVDKELKKQKQKVDKIEAE